MASFDEGEPRRRSTTVSLGELKDFRETQSSHVSLDSEDVNVGDRVLVNGKMKGTVRYLGTVLFAQGYWAGVDLDDQSGKNDGRVAGKRYFQCGANHGLFVKPQSIQKISRASNPSPSQSSLPTSPFRRTNSGGGSTPDRSTLGHYNPNRPTTTLPSNSSSSSLTNYSLSNSMNSSNYNNPNHASTSSLTMHKTESTSSLSGARMVNNNGVVSVLDQASFYKAELDKMKIELDARSKEVNELSVSSSNAKIGFENVESELKVMKIENESLKKQISSLETSFENVKSEYKAAKMELFNATSERDKMKTSYSAKDEEMSKLHRVIDKANNALLAAMNEKQQVEAEKARLSSRLNQLLNDSRTTSPHELSLQSVDASENVKLKGDLSSLQLRFKALETEKLSLSSTLEEKEKKYQSSLSKYKSSEGEHELQIRELQDTIQGMRKDLLAAQTQLSDRVDGGKVRKLESEKSFLETELEQCQELLKNTKTKMAEMQTRLSSKVKALEEENDALETQLSKSSLESGGYHRATLNQSVELAQLTSGLDALKDENKQASLKLADQNSVIEEQKKKIIALSKQIKTMEESNVEHDLRLKIASLTADLNKADRELALSNAKLSSSKSDLYQNQELQTLKRALDTTQAELQTTQRKLNDALSSLAESQETAAQYKQLSEQYEKTVHEFSSSSSSSTSVPSTTITTTNASSQNPSDTSNNGSPNKAGKVGTFASLVSSLISKSSSQHSLGAPSQNNSNHGESGIHSDKPGGAFAALVDHMLVAKLRLKLKDREGRIKKMEEEEALNQQEVDDLQDELDEMHKSLLVQKEINSKLNAQIKELLLHLDPSYKPC